MANTPAGSARNVSIGNGIVYLGDQDTTPTQDVGYLSDEGIGVTYETSISEVTAGFPATAISQFVTSVTAGLNFTSLEWNLQNFSRSMTGTLTTSTTQEVLQVGLDGCTTELTGKVQFELPCVGDTITIDFWRLQSNGALEINFDPGSSHSFSFDMRVLLATQEWDGTALTADVGLFKITRDIAP